ncbi:histidine kinase [Oceanotoga sp.]|uniref:sensor histidine kinase n=1 Tax=Oceanotoga sp. TaxID=2108366 RepID=UPI002805520F|nr:histidine kinase [Oceanotoga sp.]
MFKIKKFIKIIIINQISAFMLSALILLYTGTFYNFILNLEIALLFSNTIGLIYYFISSIINNLINDKIEIKFFNILIKIFIGTFSLFTGIQLSVLLSNMIFKIQFISYDKTFQNFLLISNMILLITAFFMIYVYRKLKKEIEIKIKENEKLNQLKLESELAALQSKINPHFLFNTLNTIIDLVYTSPEKVEEMIINLSSIYRKILYSSETELYTLDQELELVKKYLDIEKVRLGERLEYTIKVEDNLKNFKIPPLIIEPIVENSIIHGISKKIGIGHINIEVFKENKKLKILIKDDGIGFKSENIKFGFGVTSVKERLKILYSNESSFKILKNEDYGITVSISIPYK